MSIARLYTQALCIMFLVPVARSPINAVWSTKSSTLLIYLRSFTLLIRYDVRYFSDEIAYTATTSVDFRVGQPVVAVSEKSLSAPDRFRRSSPFELGRP